MSGGTKVSYVHGVQMYAVGILAYYTKVMGENIFLLYKKIKIQKYTRKP
jgi:hypothetical protein